MTYHLSVTDHAQWYKERGLEFGAILVGKCPGCWIELKPSKRVRVLRVPGDSPAVRVGDHGQVTEVIEAQESKRYVVEATESAAPWVGGHLQP